MTHRSILCFGDSNTHGTRPLAVLGEMARLDHSHRWPGVMAAALGPDWSVIEEGQPGRTITHDDPVEGAHKNGLTVLPALLETHRPLDLVIVMLGTNDLKHRFAVTPLDIARSAGRLLSVIRASNAGPNGAAPATLLICPPPIVEAGSLSEMFEGGAAKSQVLASRFAAIAEMMQVPFLDAGACAEVDLLDGIHLTEASHGRLGVSVAEAVLAQFS
ncbi:SGNH/GDSL hydrolase family protein [Pseudoruegeria sp. SK021]|uniref:SGNH/GDSL hydrolase family protein n=1 Tax=Pseudoruegeria sp. SK021 TaxID=1933035 RepID=UPI000A22F3ED|nr:SGNH/GDSL hydrolase family protein [Pseudoruegeria sp. SK021]OSP53945.1 hydrolase [Pseudoruegeria sp. SK021]